MGDVSNLVRCQQIVTADDDCCRDEICAAPATWVLRSSDSALCDEHEANARRWSGGETWRVGTTEVPYPEGWERAPGAPPAPAVNEAGVPPSGLVIERERRGGY